jgi:acyl-CoA synthetase (AMP-forming)/AMP-acid ligase II/thioesterase domain-containing protein/NAD(P)-dependent dehydrogenase (short-subunit alcohol dehydrogenase family)/acyl carrier protein
MMGRSVHNESIVAKPDSIESIERRLLSHPGVLDCAVVLRAGANETLLIALVTRLQGQEEAIVASLRLESLTRCVVLPMRVLPYTPHGEIDRARLANAVVPDVALAESAERDIRALPGVDQAVVLLEPSRALPKRLHVSTLLAGESLGLESASDPASLRAMVISDAPTRAALVSNPPLQLPEDSPRTLGAALVNAAANCSDARISYVSDANQVLEQSFRELLEEAERGLNALRQFGLQPGAYVVFLLEEPRDIIPSFWSCLLGGFVPVVCPVPGDYELPGTDLEKLRHVWSLLGKPNIVTSDASVGPVRKWVVRAGGESDSVFAAKALRMAERTTEHHSAAPSDTAFLSLTSGSTGTPKCIALTHQNILSRGRGTNVLCDHEPSDVILNWLPFDHIGSISDWHLRCVELQCKMVYCSKERILGEPLQWLRFIDRFRITHSWAPNFAYALINSALDTAGDERWDLSCLRSLLTAGEAVSSATVEELLTRLAPFGMARSAVRPAFGMAELGSGITYFRPTTEQPYAAFSVDRRSLGGTVLPLPATDRRSITFTGLGTVIAGMAMRIVDDGGEVVQERVIGNLHVKGEAVTPGYLHNPEANSRVFVGDGWFDTGDRGFIVDSQLYLTGRSKETIIVNGANYYPGELESAAQQVRGVLPSYVAACSVRPQGSLTEKVVLFVSHEHVSERRQADMLRDVTARVGQKVGIQPNFVLPFPPEEIPKTAIGKIRRDALTQRFEQGEFDDLIERTDCLLENEKTQPNWYFRPIWRRSVRRADSTPLFGDVLVLSDRAGLAQELESTLVASGARPVRIAQAERFAALADGGWELDWSDPLQLARLCSELSQRGIVPTGLLDVADYGPASELVPGGLALAERSALEPALRAECFARLALLRALTNAALLPHRCWVVASGAQPVRPTDPWVPTRALGVPFYKAFSQGLESFEFRHIDVEFDSSTAHVAQTVSSELSLAWGEQEVAYRAGERWIPALQSVVWARATDQSLAFAAGELVVISGGLGGLGRHIAQLLARRGCQVLLLGRRPADAEVLRELTRIGQVQYRQVDVTDAAGLQAVVQAASAECGCAPSVMLHLAGAAREAPMLEETPDTLLAAVEAKVFGAASMARLSNLYPNARVVLFSSAVTSIGTRVTGAYAMANAYLDGVAHVLHAAGRRVHCFNWSPWQGVGMNSNGASDAALAALGLHAISPQQGLVALLAGLRLTDERATEGVFVAPRLVVGLDANTPSVAARVHTPQGAVALQLQGYFVARDGASPTQDAVECRSELGHSIRVPLRQLSSFPVLADGQVDRDALTIEVSGQIREKKAPANDIERRLAVIFARVLRVETLGTNESFFDLGGTSLLSLRLAGEIEREFGTRVPAATLLVAPTVQQLAARLDLAPDQQVRDVIVPMTTGDSAETPSIFLVHDADGETILYRGLAKALNGARVFGVQPYGLGRAKALHTSIDEMSQYYIRRILELQPQGPYMLGGMCAGGVIAFDMACRLQEMGHQVALVALLDAADAHAPRIGATRGRAQRFVSVFNSAALLSAAPKKLANFVKYETSRRVMGATNRAKVLLLRELRRRGVAVPSLLQDLEPRTLYDFAQASYKPGRFSGSLLLFRATRADAEQERRGFSDTPAIETTQDKLLGWGQRATDGVEVIDVPGGHSSMLQEPNVAVLAEALQARIRRALAQL